MKAAIVKTAGKAPEYGDFEAPRASAGCREIRVAASALSHVTRSRAAGVHYTSDTAGQGLPFVAGVDGTGVDADGRRVYFFGPVAPHGAMAERTLVGDAHCLPLPDALDDVTAAALAIPAMSSWAALKERARLEFGETVLVNGATGSSGRLAVQIAKYLGAGKVIATGRDATALGELSALGADVLVPLGQDETLGEALREQFAGGVDIVLDYLWGPSAHALLGAAARAAGPGRAALRADRRDRRRRDLLAGGGVALHRDHADGQRHGQRADADVAGGAAHGARYRAASGAEDRHASGAARATRRGLGEGG